MSRMNVWSRLYTCLVWNRLQDTILKEAGMYEDRTCKDTIYKEEM